MTREILCVFGWYVVGLVTPFALIVLIGIFFS
jgi:hypothetical protein